MGVTIQLKHFLHEQEADEALIDLVPSLEKLLPEGVKFNQDTWNLLAWVPRKGTAKKYNVFFTNINNKELKTLVKIYLLEKRQSKGLSGRAVKALLPMVVHLDQALGTRPIHKISNAVFSEAQKLIVGKHRGTSPQRQANYLQLFGEWLSANLGYRISYRSTLVSNYFHGRKASDKDRDEKLIDSRILMDLVAAVQRGDLSDKDRFYLSAFVILVGTGFRITELATLPRITELATLPKDCLVREGENVGIRHFPVKKPKLDTHWVLSSWVPVIEDAIGKLVSMTESGREIVASLQKKPGLDWPEIYKNKEAIEYFVAKFCHEWTAIPQHYMFNKTGAWVEKKGCYIDVVGIVEKAVSKSEAARQLGVSRPTIDSFLAAQQAALRNALPSTAQSRGKAERTSWDTDSRVVSILRLEEYTDLKIKGDSRKWAIALVKNAQTSYQLMGEVYPCPSYNEALERRFKRIIHPVVETKDGKPVLQPEEAMFILAKYQLSESRGTKADNFSLLDSGQFIRWFCGEKRSLGTKKPEDSCFSRLDIFDPKTGEIAKFTSHDIRHWLTTFYLEGGMPSDQVALLFNRSANQNDTYDQTSSKTRLNNMRQAIRDGGAMGHVADTFHEIAEYSREEAEQYLEASTLQLNLMPHGGCSLNWGVKACPNHNGCFNGDNGVCEHLCVDPTDEKTKEELSRMVGETETALQVIPEQSPQYSHYQNIQRNINQLFGELKGE